MQPIDFDEILHQVIERDPRYTREAYLFLRHALDHTQRLVAKVNKDEIRHVSGQELLAGIRQFALEQFGPMAMFVLDQWGVHTCEDFGELVFNLVDANLLAKTDRDSRDDFKGGYSFEEAFRRPFLPREKAAPLPQPSPGKGSKT